MSNWLLIPANIYKEDGTEGLRILQNTKPDIKYQHQGTARLQDVMEGVATTKGMEQLQVILFLAQKIL